MSAHSELKDDPGKAIKKRIKEKYTIKGPQFTVDIDALVEWLARLRGGIGRTRNANWLATEILMDSVKIDGKRITLEQASNLIDSKIQN